VPAWGARRVWGVDPANFKVAVHIFVETAGEWWIKPTFASPLTSIASDSTWTTAIVGGGNHRYATRIVAFLVPNGLAKGLNVHVARGGQDPICPAVGKERVFQVAVHQGRIGLRQDQAAPERRLAGRDQQAVVTPGQAPRQGPGGIGPEAVGEAPLPAFGLDEVAADLATEAHDIG
jgi:hypothetical protein